MSDVSRPYNLVAELTYRCPLRCAYCSNPLNFAAARDELTTEQWCEVFSQAASLGVMQLHLSGGEPLARRDIVELVASGRRANLYINLITSGIGLTEDRLQALRDAGLDHVQLSFQGADAITADAVAGVAAHRTKQEVAARVRAAGLSLTINVVLHRRNIAQVPQLIAMAVALGADRLELANTQYYAWALLNRRALLPTLEQLEAAEAAVLQWRRQPTARLEIAYVQADYYAQYPKPCMEGWAQRTLCITPVGLVLPCHAAQVIRTLTFDNIRDAPLASIWQHSTALNAFRGESWMQTPCRTCPRKSVDYGGCRCQAYLLAGEARATDPVCHLAPRHDVIAEARQAAGVPDETPFTYRTVINSREIG